ncbi:MAG: hypothetical protein JNG89_16840 [Planctomycetaceae bacterium]|nr:hypothetical protein [Planctomycetaceae bacterium]
MHKYPLRAGMAGLVLGVPLSLTAGGAVPGDSAAPVIQQAGAATQATPVAAPQQPSQFQSQQYQNEVQRQLQMLYQQEQSGQRPQPPQGAAPRKMRMKDWFNPSAWKRHNARRQREREREEQRRQAAASPETDLGAPADFSHGGAAPMPTAPSVPLSTAQAPPSALSAPDSSRAPAALPAIAPAPAASASAARPQLQRVSPDIFAGEAPAPAVTAAPPSFPPAAPPAEFRTAQAPIEQHPPAQTAEPQVAQTPLLILVPNPEPAQQLAATPEAPPAELPIADVSLSAPASDITVDGFINEPAPASDSEFTQAEQDLLFASPSEPEIAAEPEAAPLNAAPSGPFTGLELDNNPFAEPSPEQVAATRLPAEPLPLAAPVQEEPAPALSAPAELPAAHPEALLAPLPDADAPAAFPASNIAAPAALNAPAGRPLSGSPISFATAPQGEVQVKLSRIAERKGLTGFKGFCPVMLKDHRELVDAKLEHTVEYSGRQYWFSSATARQQFLADPTAYIPARNGIDVVLFDRTGESRDGSLDHAVWYKGQLYLFDSTESQAEFAAAPQAHQVSE